jgi:hypothetical protein
MERIIFDRSIFHGAKFQRLKSSGIASGVRAGQYKVLLTPMFIEETLAHAINNPTEFSDHWTFIASLVGHKWFKLAEEIVAIELGDSIRGKNYFLQPKVRQRRAIRIVKDLMDRKLTDDQLKEPLLEVKRNMESRKEFRRNRLELRQTIRPGEYELDSYFNSNVEWFIEKGLMPHHKNSANYLNTWRTKREQCVFTQQFIKAWFATILLPVRDHQLRIDTNDRPDAEQLAFLIWADTIVSDDKRFMRKAFDLLYANSQKKCLTLEQFLA